MGKSRLFCFFFFLLLLLGVSSIIFQKQIQRLKKKHKELAGVVQGLRFDALTANSLGKVSTSSQLAKIPFGEDTGLVLGVKTVSIRDVYAPHNPALVASDSGYTMFFRYDVFDQKAKYEPYYSRIGAALLDEKFEQTAAPFQKISLPSDHVEDPRALFIKDELYLIFSMINLEKPKQRLMYLANLNKDTLQVKYATALEQNRKPVEKNWNPFIYTEPEGPSLLCFEYHIPSRDVLAFPDPRLNQARQLQKRLPVSPLTVEWSQKWGKKLRGGAPAQKIGDEYLGFFHSAFREENGLVLYVMGAYTFEAKPPFALTGISKEPILFRGIYTTPAINTAQRNKRVIFPSAFICETKGAQKLLHVACGENDSAIKILTLDQEKLFESLRRSE